jgi:hypothetical protein
MKRVLQSSGFALLKDEALFCRRASRGLPGSSLARPAQRAHARAICFINPDRLPAPVTQNSKLLTQNFLLSLATKPFARRAADRDPEMD